MNERSAGRLFLQPVLALQKKKSGAIEGSRRELVLSVRASVLAGAEIEARRDAAADSPADGHEHDSTHAHSNGLAG
jgi:hypothetical protein